MMHRHSRLIMTGGLMSHRPSSMYRHWTKASGAVRLSTVMQYLPYLLREMKHQKNYSVQNAGCKISSGEIMKLRWYMKVCSPTGACASVAIIRKTEHSI